MSVLVCAFQLGLADITSEAAPVIDRPPLHPGTRAFRPDESSCAKSTEPLAAPTPTPTPTPTILRSAEATPVFSDPPMFVAAANGVGWDGASARGQQHSQAGDDDAKRAGGAAAAAASGPAAEDRGAPAPAPAPPSLFPPLLPLIDRIQRLEVPHACVSMRSRTPLWQFVSPGLRAHRAPSLYTPTHT
jgi:hypothetical protein